MRQNQPGYDFDPKWYGCGTAHYARSHDGCAVGVVYLISRRNLWLRHHDTEQRRASPYLEPISPSRTRRTPRAISVGSVHKSSPPHLRHFLFLSKGPTGWPHNPTVAPGEKVISCALTNRRQSCLQGSQRHQHGCTPRLGASRHSFVRSEFPGAAW